MKLTLQERQVLTVMHDISVQDFVHYARRYLDIETDQIRSIAEKLKKEGYVEVLEGADKEDLLYEHSKKVTPEMIDEKVDSMVKYGMDKK